MQWLQQYDSCARELLVLTHFHSLAHLQADLMSPGSFDAAVAGCRYVIHVASPVLPRIPPGKGQELLIEPAVRGVENVLAAVAKSLSVEAVVVTSSIGALLGDNDEKGRGVAFTEADWAQTTSAERLPYNHSKRQAERRAWELHDAQPQGGHRWRLATILPGFVVGPPASPDVPAEGVAFAKDLLTGRFWPAFPHAGFPFVGELRYVAGGCWLLGSRWLFASDPPRNTPSHVQMWTTLRRRMCWP